MTRFDKSAERKTIIATLLIGNVNRGVQSSPYREHLSSSFCIANRSIVCPRFSKRDTCELTCSVKPFNTIFNPDKISKRSTLSYAFVLFRSNSESFSLDASGQVCSKFFNLALPQFLVFHSLVWTHRSNSSFAPRELFPRSSVPNVLHFLCIVNFYALPRKQSEVLYLVRPNCDDNVSKILYDCKLRLVTEC